MAVRVEWVDRRRVAGYNSDFVPPGRNPIADGRVISLPPVSS